MTEKHGYVTYTRGCRCDVCRVGKREYMRARRAAGRRAAQRFTDDTGRHFVPAITHGRFGYEERGCRCQVCMAARAAVDEYLRARRRSRAVSIEGGAAS